MRTVRDYWNLKIKENFARRSALPPVCPLIRFSNYEKTKMAPKEPHYFISKKNMFNEITRSKTNSIKRSGFHANQNLETRTAYQGTSLRRG